MFSAEEKHPGIAGNVKLWGQEKVHGKFLANTVCRNRVHVINSVLCGTVYSTFSPLETDRVQL